MPLERLMRMTSSPAAGLCVVPLVTVPVSVCAAAASVRHSQTPTMTGGLRKAGGTTEVVRFKPTPLMRSSCRRDAYLRVFRRDSGLRRDRGLLEAADLRQDRRGFFFQRRAHRLIVGLGYFAFLSFDIQ